MMAAAPPAPLGNWEVANPAILHTLWKKENGSVCVCVCVCACVRVCDCVTVFFPFRGLIQREAKREAEALTPKLPSPMDVHRHPTHFPHRMT